MTSLSGWQASGSCSPVLATLSSVIPGLPGC